jgi:quercetin dioxygenase-like cupin family protein
VDPTTTKQLNVGLADGTALELEGTPSVIKLRSEETGGTCSAIEHTLLPHILVPPHSHATYDHTTYVIRGPVGFMVGGVEGVAEDGEYVFMPKGTVHALWNPTDEPITYLHVTTPGGFEGYFEDMAEQFKGAKPPKEDLKALSARYGGRYYPDLIADLEARHGVQAAT